MQLNINLQERIPQMEIENHMIVEARQQFIMEQAAELMEQAFAEPE